MDCNGTPDQAIDMVMQMTTVSANVLLSNSIGLQEWE